MLQNKLIIVIGALVFVTLTTGLIMLGIQQRQTTRPDAQQVDDTLSCPIGSVQPDPAGRCPSGFIPVPVYPTDGQPQAIGGTTGIDSGAFGGGNIGDDIGPTGLVNSTPTPTPRVIGFCCVPLTQSTPTPTPFGIPTPTIPITPNLPTPTSCPRGSDQLTVDSQIGCSSTDRCDFSVTTDGSGNILTRSLWSDGNMTFGAQDQSVQRLDEAAFTYDSTGTYDISLACGDTLSTCTKQITITDPIPGACTTPTIPVTLSPTPTPTNPVTPTITITPTPPACRIPMPTLHIRCPDGCSEL